MSENLESIKNLAETSKLIAQKCVKEGNFGRAFSHFLVALKLIPEWNEELKEEFTATLYKWGTFLHQRKKFNELIKCYEVAIEVFPQNEIVLNNFGAYMLRWGYIKTAAHYFRESLRVRPGYLRAANNLEEAGNVAVDRWHYPMLNDRHRNEAFRQAIIGKVSQGFDVVLDIGTGTGILSLFSVEGKAKKIYACDYSPTMIEIAEQVFYKNNVQTVKLINKHSIDLLPDDIPEKVSLVITETLDSGLLGENILATVDHAWKNLLRPPFSSSSCGKFGFVIPFAATLYLTGIECDDIYNTSYPKEYLFGVPVFKSAEVYDTRNLRNVPFKILTQVEEIIKINFNDPKMIKEVMDGAYDRKVRLSCHQSGRLDCFAVWFDLMLDEAITLSTSPSSQSNEAWDQAVYFLPRVAYCQAGEEIIVPISFEGGVMGMKFSDVPDCRLQPSEETVKMLNDEILMRSLEEVRCKLVASKIASNPINILDCFSFPVFGLNFLVQRKRKFNDRLTCFVPKETDRDVVEAVARKHGFEEKVAVEPSLKTWANTEEKFDLVLVNFVNSNGELNDDVMSYLGSLRSLLKPDGIFIPENITIMGQLVRSDWLNKMCRVKDDIVTCGYKISEFINQYQNYHFVEIDPASFECTICSESFVLFDLFTSETSFEKFVQLYPDSPPPNAVMYWFKIKLSNDLEEITTNRKTSFCFQAAYRLSELPKHFEKVKLSVVRDDGLFKIEISNS